MKYKKGGIRFILVICLLGAAWMSSWLNEENQDDLAITWAYTKLAGMSVEEKVGQLIMVQAYSNKGESHLKEVLEWVSTYKVGGVVFFQGNPARQWEMTETLQQASQIPLLVAMDAEWGLGMRLENTISFPRQFTLGAIQDNRLIYDMGKEIGRQMTELGVHLNFAPVADINMLEKNPVIGDRSFGQDKKNVAQKSYAYMRGLQDEGIMACVKHFPGHGSTDKDSHLTLPKVDRTRAQLSEQELFPFRLLFDQGVKSVMVGHLEVPALEKKKNRPASLSKSVVRQMIREEMHFEGLIITDALGMLGVAGSSRPGKLEKEAFLAGNDVLLGPSSVSMACKTLIRAVQEGEITKERLDESVMRILVAKFHAGLFFPPVFEEKDLDKALNPPHALALRERLYEEALTYLPGQGKGLLPILHPSQKKIAVVSLGNPVQNRFQERISDFTVSSRYQLPMDASSKSLDKLVRELSGYEVVIVAFLEMNRRISKNYGISAEVLKFLRQVEEKSSVCLVLFGNPYSLKLFNRREDILLAYEPDPMAQDMAAQALFGAVGTKGKLPVEGGAAYATGEGSILFPRGILSYSKPEREGMSSDTLRLADSLISEMIRTGAAPGCQLLVARNGHIVWEKAYGFHTYEKIRAVQTDDLYDLASVTKVMATTLAVMKLYEDGQIDLFAPLSDYLEGYIDSTDKSDITVIEAMTHHAGLAAWIPFFKKTLDTLEDFSVVPSGRLYSRTPDSVFSVPVAEDLYLRGDYADTIRLAILTSELDEKKTYRYSDLGMYLVRDVVEAITGMPFDEYLKKSWYDPLELHHTGFNPLHWYPRDRIVPSERDTYWRRQELRGNVHDMGAAMLGGVSGHAGLFSNARDLAVLMQLLIDQGRYGQDRFLSRKTVYTFTSRYNRSSRRGIGFDMKELDEKKGANISEYASTATFGHYGFTGTCVFGDPDEKLVYIFLSNRTYPTMENKKLIRDNYRSRIQDLLYRSIID